MLEGLLLADVILCPVPFLISSQQAHFDVKTNLCENPNRITAP